jgi:hypothetical protein
MTESNGAEGPIGNSAAYLSLWPKRCASQELASPRMGQAMPDAATHATYAERPLM